MFLLDDIFDTENLKLAMENILSKRDSCGIDGVYISEFEEYWEINHYNIIEMVKKGSYVPQVIQEFDVMKPDGRRRTLAKYATLDKFLLRAVVQVMNDRMDSKLSDSCYAYRVRKGVGVAIRKAADYLEEGYIWVAEMDIEHYFDQINISRMEAILKDFLHDDSVRSFVVMYLRCTLERDYERYTKLKGLVQGNPLSPILSNFYLLSFDNELEHRGFRFLRFADNINIYTKTREEAVKVLALCKELLQNLDLNLNRRKTGVYEGIKRRYLGYEFVVDKKSNKVIAKRYKRTGNVQYNNWHSTSLQRIGKNYHIINNGILTKKDFSILFENEGGKKILPVETAESINVYSNIVFNSDFFHYANQKRLRINFFDKYGRGIGSFVTTNGESNARTMLKQVEIYLDGQRRLDNAKKIIMAGMHNLRSNLRYYKKTKGEIGFQNSINQLTQIIVEMNQSAAIGELMLIEARGRQVYYQTLNNIVTNQDFLFTIRTKRPPKDALNAMISFGNVYLYNRIATEIRKTSLDIRIGFLHSTNRRYESLNLDIAEIFKPLIVDRVIFTLINKNMIHVLNSFENTNGGVYLNKIGKEILLSELERKIYSKLTIGASTMTYDTLIRIEIQKLLKMVLHGVEYKPYKYTT